MKKTNIIHTNFSKIYQPQIEKFGKNKKIWLSAAPLIYDKIYKERIVLWFVP